ncbi:MAG: MerR family transcriptional regulator [Ruminococcus sp.]|nr:MerR family transcriptional regulator [Ruminococcus sp.]
MKIKEVCIKTGLTEKAVRYYVENGLLFPEEYTMRERTYREYSDEDVNTLRAITTLRKIGMSVESIREVGQGRAQEIMQGYLKDLGSEVERKQRLLAALSQADMTGIASAEELAELIKDATKAEPTPPDFSHFDEPAGSRLKAFEQRSFEREQEHRKGSRLAFLVTVALLFGSIPALTSFIGLLLFLAVSIAAVGTGSDYVGFYRAVCLSGAAADAVGFFKTLSELENKNLIAQLALGTEMEQEAFGCILYLFAFAALAGALVLLLTSRALIEYLSDR